MEVYRRWRDTFENASLYKEVFNELAAVDDYISMKRTRRIEIITATTLPLVVLGTIFGTNFDLVEGLPLWPWWALGIFVTLTLVWGLWYWFSSRN
jgi:Mg2+ and Co2+ transporter CorA